MSHEWVVRGGIESPVDLQRALNDLDDMGYEIYEINHLFWARQEMEIWRVIARRYVATPAEPEEDNAFFKL